VFYFIYILYNNNKTRAKAKYISYLSKNISV